MPRGDGTGPMGLGPMTGRRAGYCAGYGRPGYANPTVPRYGYGWGGGWGWRHGGWGGWRWHHWAVPPFGYRYGPPPAWGWGSITPEQEQAYLRQEAAWLREQLDAIQQRLDDLAQASGGGTSQTQGEG